MKRPNIIFFFTDQQRWDTCGCYGQPLPVTPNIDKMAQEGVIFNNAFTCQPVCGPARACLQTGKYATETGCFRNDIGLPVDEKTIAHHFTEHGYKVGYIGKWHLASNYSPFSDKYKPEGVVSYDFRTKPVPVMFRGGWKDEWIASDLLEFTSHAYGGHMFDKDNQVKKFPPGRYRVDVQTDWALEVIERWSGEEQPFFLFLSYLEPHHQNDRNRYEGPIGSKEKFADFVVPGDLEGEEGDWRENYPDYLGCVNSLDYNLGRIRNKLKECGIEDKTVIIFSSDHGSHFRTRNRGLQGDSYDDYKRSCHAACTHIPLVIYGPGFTGGKRIDNMVSLIDLPATFLDIAGIPVPHTFKGSSLKRLVAGEAPEWKDEVFIQISESQVGRAIRTKDWCYSVYAPDKNPWLHMDSRVYVEQFLYDVKNDPYEKHNLVSDPKYEKVRAELRSRLLAKMKEAGEEIPQILPAIKG